jgi:hypothetical protein
MPLWNRAEALDDTVEPNRQPNFEMAIRRLLRVFVPVHATRTGPRASYQTRPIGTGRHVPQQELHLLAHAPADSVRHRCASEIIGII